MEEEIGLTYWGQEIRCGIIYVNNGSVNGLLPDGTKPLADQMLTYRQWDPKEHISVHFLR